MKSHSNTVCAAVLLVIAISVTPVSLSAQTDTFACPTGTEPFSEYRLFFGRSRGHVEVVNNTAWQTFLAREITPRFPAGLTVLDARGQWQDAMGLMVRERTKLVIILARPSDEGIRLTDEITEAYKRAFGQESVLRAISTACVSL